MDEPEAVFFEDDWWYLAWAYADMETAGRDYERASGVLRRPNPLDASVYRMQLNNQPMVIVIGEGQLPEPFGDLFKQACTRGTPAELPLDVQTILALRNLQSRIPGGGFWERRGPK